ncbi:hypothetical protein V6Z11_A08G103600 [Gossypium hirsutum]
MVRYLPKPKGNPPTPLLQAVKFLSSTITPTFDVIQCKQIFMCT